MISAKVIWTDKERYIGESDSRHALVMDTAHEKTANTPMELVLIALCGCTGSDVVGILRKKREPFTRLEISAHGERATDYPRLVYTAIKLGESIALVAKFRRRRSKTRYGFPKKNIARFRPCWKRAPRLLSRLCTRIDGPSHILQRLNPSLENRHGKTRCADISSSSRLRLCGECAPHWGMRSLHRKNTAGRGSGASH